MRICSLLVLLVTLTRCAPDDACVRSSDCGVGGTCRAGTCEPTGGATEVPNVTVEAGTADAQVKDAASSVEGGARDAAKEASAEGGSAATADASAP